MSLSAAEKAQVTRLRNEVTKLWPDGASDLCTVFEASIWAATHTRRLSRHRLRGAALDVRDRARLLRLERSDLARRRMPPVEALAACDRLLALTAGPGEAGR